jgi:uncharacterized membrane protein
LIFVAALAILFRLPYLTQRSLWYDEASSWQTASFPLEELFKSVRLNVHMPLYYLLLKAWMGAFGESVLAIRGFSVAFGVATVLAMNAFGRELYRASAASADDDPDRLDARARTFGLILAGLVAVSPCQVFASIEARMYSLGTALAALSSWLLLRVIRESRGRRLWVAYGFSLALLPYAHHYGLFTVAAQFLFLGLYVLYLTSLGEFERARPIIRAAIAVGAIAAVAYLPGLDILTTQAGRVRQDYWVRELSWPIFFGTFNEFVVPMPDYDQLENGWIPFAVFAGSCLVIAWRGRRGDGFVLALALVPLFLSAAVSAVLTPVWVGRFFRFTHLFVLAVVALAAWRIARERKALLSSVVAVLFAILIASNVVFWRKLNLDEGQGIRGAVEFILANRRPDETIVALDALQYFPAKYYVGEKARIAMVEPAPDLFWGWHLIRPSDVITSERLDDEVSRGVWLIGTLPRPAITARLASNSPRAQQVFTYYNHLHARVYVHRYCTSEGTQP